MATDNLTVVLKVKVKGLWRITLLGWMIRWWRLREQVTVSLKERR